MKAYFLQLTLDLYRLKRESPAFQFLCLILAQSLAFMIYGDATGSCYRMVRR